jgi:hypothetical protein
LPVGASYSSSLGDFSLSADGKLTVGPAQLRPDVTLVDNCLRRTVAAPAPATASASNVAKVLISEKKGLTFNVFVPPLSPPGEPIWLAVSKTKYELATQQPFAADQCTAHWRLDASGPAERPAKLELGPGPAEAVAAAAASELAVDPADLLWLKLSVYPGAYGPVAFQLNFKPTGSISTSVLVADLGEQIQLVPHRWRTAWAETETALYTVYLSGDVPAASGHLFLQSDEPGAKPVELATLALPAVAQGQFDSRLIQIAPSWSTR